MTEIVDPQVIAQATLLKRYDLLIAGQLQPAAEATSFAVDNPATQTLLTKVPNAGQADIQQALDAAAAAFPRWSATPASQRAALLQRVAALLIERRERLATVMTLEQGKPLAEARGEITYAAGFLQWFAGEAERIYGMTLAPPVAEKRLLVLRQAVGVAALITPWNFPMAMLTRKLGPALAAGCTVVCKPAEQTPLCALELGRLFVEAGAPAGVVNMLSMADPQPFADAVFADERVRKISFTGSTEVGIELLTRSAAQVKRISLELGGQAPLIVFPDADLPGAVEGALASKFRNAGQTCVCANRFFIHRDIYAEFASLFTAAVAKLEVGNGLQPTVHVGPLIDQHAVAKVRQHLQDALEQGAQVLVGGQQPAQMGGSTFWQPTVLVDATPAMVVAREETFGPLAPLIAFDDHDDVVALANDSRYGLAAYFFTRDIGRVWQVAERLEYGIVGVNDGVPATPTAPFGGYKQSGLGREGGPTGIDEYLETKYVSIRLK